MFLRAPQPDLPGVGRDPSRICAFLLSGVVKMKRIVSNMARAVLEYLFTPGEKIAVVQDVLMLESMKMQIPILSTVIGVVKTIKVNEGDFVDDGDVLMEVE